MRLGSRILTITFALVLSLVARADEASELIARYSRLPEVPLRIEAISAELLGRPYEGGPLGEGPEGRYDRDPLERLDAFDCTTFVETVTALATSESRQEYFERLQRLRYRDGVIDFTARNHFPSADWVPNNIAAGFFEDLTARILVPGVPSVALARIDKPNWYGKMTVARIQRNDLSDEQKLALLEELRAEGEQFPVEEVSLQYVPFTSLFDEAGGAVEELFDRIPSGAVVNVVRPGWNLVEAIGTQMNVSHQGLAIRKDGVLYLRHASDAVGKVADQPLDEYLRRFLASPTIRGIHLLEVR